MVQGIDSSKLFTPIKLAKIDIYYPKAKPNKPLPQGSKMFIDFTQLPIDLKTEENRKKYDKDMNGFLDPNEVYNMQQAYPDMDLSIYRNDKIDHVTNYHNEEKGGMVADAYDKNGNVVVRTEDQAFWWDDETAYRRTEFKKEGNSTVSTSDAYDLGGARLDNHPFVRETQNATYKGKAGYAKTEMEVGNGIIVTYEKGAHLIKEYYNEMGVLRETYEQCELPKEGPFEKYYEANTYYDENGKLKSKHIERSVVLNPSNKYGISVLGFWDEDENGKVQYSPSVPCEEIKTYDANNRLVYHEINGRNIEGDMDFKRIVLVDELEENEY